MLQKQPTLVVTASLSIAAASARISRSSGWRTAAPRTHGGMIHETISCMDALTVVPGQVGSVSLANVPDPPATDGPILVDTLCIGICGTDHEILSGEFGSLPAHDNALIIGHESLGRVVSCPPGSGFAAGDLVVGIVRRPDPVPCQYCAAGEWDMCRNGGYTERGIKQRHGYASSQFRVEPEFAIRVDGTLERTGVLVEPASVLAKAWEHVDRIGRRSAAWDPRTLLVTGAGPIGLLAALMGRQRGLDVHVFNRSDDRVKVELVRALDGTFHSGAMDALGELHPDVIMECTGAPPVIADVLTRSAPSGIVCLTGVSASGKKIPLDVGAMNRSIVLENDVVFGSVNANRRHYEQAAESLLRADERWLSRMITRRVPLSRWPDAFMRQDGDVKVVIDFQPAA